MCSARFDRYSVSVNRKMEIDKKNKSPVIKERCLTASITLHLSFYDPPLSVMSTPQPCLASKVVSPCSFFLNFFLLSFGKRDG